MKKIHFITALLIGALTLPLSAASNFPEAKEIVKQMEFGWNLGNTLDATSYGRNAGLSTETVWGQPKTTKAMIDGLAASGIKTIRIPTSWHNHIAGDNYKIDPAWMARVKEIVDWAYSNKMFIILNTHHDNYERNSPIPAGSGYYYPSQENYEESEKYLTSVWTQISATFKDYDYHLIFETMNEPRPCGTNFEWWYNQSSMECKKYMGSVNKLNQAIVNTIRNSGGNNSKRMIMVPSLSASPDSALSADFRIPEDASKQLAVSVHMYTPYKFAMESPGDINFTNAHKAELTSIFKRLNSKFVSQGIPVVIGEMGATNKDNIDARKEWFDFFITEAKKYGLPASCVWDNGVWQIEANKPANQKYSEHYGYYNRREQKWYFPELIETAKKAAKN